MPLDVQAFRPVVPCPRRDDTVPVSPARLARVLAVALLGASLLATPARADDPGEGTPMPLGTYTVTAVADRSCPAGYTCQSFSIACPGVLMAAKGWLAVAPPTAPMRGLVVMPGGSTGTLYWSTKSVLTTTMTENLRVAGFEIVQVKFKKRWMGSSNGELAGPAALSCRFA